MNFLITGGAGFVGTYLCDRLFQLGHHIKIVDIDQKAMINPNYYHLVIDILDKESLSSAMNGTDCVVHLAAKHRFFGVSEKDFFLVNDVGTGNVLECMEAHGVDKIIFYSSVAVYGESDEPTDEKKVPRPFNPYGQSKLAAENRVKEWTEKTPGRSAVVIRPTVIFGPNNKGNIYRLIRQIYNHAYIPIGEGDNIKSIAYIENITDATIFLMDRNLMGFNIYNYSDAPHMTYREIVNLIYSYMGRSAPNHYLPYNPMLGIAKGLDRIISKLNIEFSFSAAIKKINTNTHHYSEKINIIGFLPRFSSKDGLEKMVDWYVEKNNRRKRSYRK